MKNLPSPKRKLTAICAALFCLVLFVVSNSDTFAQTQESYETRRAKAFKLFEETKYDQALPLFEQLAKEKPNDAEIMEFYGILVYIEARNLKDAESRKKGRLKAREILLKAKSLGADSALMHNILETVPPDGGKDVTFSDSAEVDKAMQEGEAAFSSGNMDKAIEFYQKALKLDPKHYEAALFIGDAYHHKGDFEKAAEWYAKTIAINPDIETAYRYWGTILVKQNKMAEARDKYIESFIRDPYSRLSRSGIIGWANINKVTLAHPKINIPSSVSTSPSGNISITDGTSGNKDDGSAAWFWYGMKRVLWQQGKEGLGKKFKEKFPGETKYRHSLAEEMDAFSGVLAALNTQIKENKVKQLDPSLAILKKLNDEGLLEAYILLAMTDEGIAQDYYPYFKNNQDKLRRYVVNYILTGGGQ